MLLNADGTLDKTTVIPASGVVPAGARQFFLNFNTDEGMFVWVTHPRLGMRAVLMSTRGPD